MSGPWLCRPCRDGNHSRHGYGCLSADCGCAASDAALRSVDVILRKALDRIVYGARWHGIHGGGCYWCAADDSQVHEEKCPAAIAKAAIHEAVGAAQETGT